MNPLVMFLSLYASEARSGVHAGDYRNGFWIAMVGASGLFRH